MILKNQRNIGLHVSSYFISHTIFSQVVYGGTVSPTGDEHRNMSEKVQNMASAIYREFELMIQRYGEDGVKVSFFSSNVDKPRHFYF